MTQEVRAHPGPRARLDHADEADAPEEGHHGVPISTATAPPSAARTVTSSGPTPHEASTMNDSTKCDLRR